MSIGNFLESLSQRIVGIILVGRLGVRLIDNGSGKARVVLITPLKYVLAGCVQLPKPDFASCLSDCSLGRTELLDGRRIASRLICPVVYGLCYYMCMPVMSSLLLMYERMTPLLS